MTYSVLHTVQSLGHNTSGFIKRSVAVFVGNGHQSTGRNQFLSNRLVSPETCVVQSSVSVFVCDIYIGAIPKQLRKPSFIIRHLIKQAISTKMTLLCAKFLLPVVLSPCACALKPDATACRLLCWWHWHVLLCWQATRPISSVLLCNTNEAD